MLCELCGQEAPFLKPLLVEGSLLKVCSNCAKFGKPTPESQQIGTSSTSDRAVNSDQRGASTGRSGGSSFSYEGPSKDEIIRRRLEFRERRMTSKDVYEQSGEKELVDDYHKRIQQARDNLGWNQEQLGQKINERKSIISKLENRSIKPD
jgi:putative transcription factor